MHVERGRGTTCREVMRNFVDRARSEQTIASAARMMRDANIGWMPVCESTGMIRGVLTDRDITVRAVASEQLPAHTRVDDVLTRRVVSCRPGELVADAHRRMTSHGVSRIVVLDECRRLIGVIVLSELDLSQTPSSR